MGKRLGFGVICAILVGVMTGCNSPRSGSGSSTPRSSGGGYSSGGSSGGGGFSSGSGSR